jgi:putative ABC transport system substrate-binding protein
MRRRTFGSLVAGMAAAPLVTLCQEKVRRVGLLSNGSETPQPGVPTTWHGELLRVLAANGFHRGKNLELLDRYSDGDVDRLKPLAREIAGVGVEVVLAVGSLATRAVLAAGETASIVMITGDDPVTAGFVVNFARPGGRVTGLHFRTGEGDAKRLELLREALPGARRFGFLKYRGAAPRTLEAVLQASRQLGVTLVVHPVEYPGEYPAALDAMKKEGVAGVLVQAAQAFASSVLPLATAANARGLPTMCEWEFMARAGCMLGYGHDLGYAQRRAGEYVARILKGATAAHLPVEQSDAWRLTVNLGIASRLGLTIPTTILARADEVIE